MVNTGFGWWGFPCRNVDKLIIAETKKKSLTVKSIQAAFLTFEIVSIWRIWVNQFENAYMFKSKIELGDDDKCEWQHVFQYLFLPQH